MTQLPLLDPARPAAGLAPGELLAKAEAETLASLEARVKAGRLLRPGEMRTLRELAAKQAGTETAANLEEVAAALGVVKRTVLRWSERSAIPQEEGGWYDLARVREWAAPFLADLDGAEVLAGGPEGLVSWKREREREGALLARVKRQILEGDLIPRARVVPEFTRRALEVKEKTLGLARGLALRLVGTWTDPREVAAVLAPYVREIVASYGRELPEELTGGEPAALHLVPEAALVALAAELPDDLAREPGQAAAVAARWAARLRGAAAVAARADGGEG